MGEYSAEDYYKERFYSTEMLMKYGKANCDRLYNFEKKKERRLARKNNFRSLIASIVKLVLIVGIVYLLFRIFV